VRRFRRIGRLPRCGKSSSLNAGCRGRSGSRRRTAAARTPPTIPRHVPRAQVIFHHHSKPGSCVQGSWRFARGARSPRWRSSEGQTRNSKEHIPRASSPGWPATDARFARDYGRYAAAYADIHTGCGGPGAMETRRGYVANRRESGAVEKSRIPEAPLWMLVAKAAVQSCFHKAGL